MQNNLLQFVKQTIKNGGASYCMHTGQMNPETGYMVSLQEYNLPVDTTELSYAEIEYEIKHYTSQVNYVYLYERHAPEDSFLGTWFDGDILHLDVSINVDNLDEAIKLGRLNKQIAIYDCANKIDIVL